MKAVAGKNLYDFTLIREIISNLGATSGPKRRRDPKELPLDCPLEPSTAPVNPFVTVRAVLTRSRT